MKYPIKRYEASRDTGSILVVDANEDCVCMCDDEEMANNVVKRLNATFRVAYDQTSRPEAESINAAQIIGWAHTVRSSSAGFRWTETELKLAYAIAAIASGNEPQL